MKIKIIKSIIIIFSLFALSKAIAEPFDFNDNVSDNVIDEIRTFSFDSKYELIKDIKFKLNNLDVNKKTSLLKKKVDNIEMEEKLQNIRQYVLYKYFINNKKKLNINFYRRGYQVISRSDLQADIHPYYLLKLEKKIKEKKILNENDNKFKSYVFLIASLKGIKGYSKIDDIVGNMENLINKDDFLINSGSYERYLNKLVSEEKINIFSLADFNRIRAKIIDEKISPNSNYFHAFLYWYNKSKEIFKDSRVVLKNSILHDVQTKKLSCEANSTTDFINYFYSKNLNLSISEQEIIDLIPTQPTSLELTTNNELLWGDPSEHFVGEMDGKQSRNPQNLSGYGIYADPLVKIINSKVKNIGIKVQKNYFKEKIILEALSKGSPVMFWYLLPVKLGNSIGYNFNPISWKTAYGKNINGYIGEHTGIIIGASLKKDGSINNLYYYEGKEKELKVTNFIEIEKTARIFDEIIHSTNS